MYQPKTEKDIRCPLEYGMNLFGGKWKSRIICVLSEQPSLRYGELRREMVNITDAVLAAALKELVASGLVSRTQYDEIPPRVEYSLTERGHSLRPIFHQICRWAGRHARETAEDIPGRCRRCDYDGRKC